MPVLESRRTSTPKESWRPTSGLTLVGMDTPRPPPKIVRKGHLLLALLALSGLGLAQRAVSFRLSLPPAGLGVGLEASLERNLAFRGYGDLFPSGPSFLLAGEVLFKPDLGQVDRDLKGIRPIPPPPPSYPRRSFRRKGDRSHPGLTEAP